MRSTLLLVLCQLIAGAQTPTPKTTAPKPASAKPATAKPAIATKPATAKPASAKPAKAVKPAPASKPAPAAKPATASPVVMTVDGEQVTKADFELLLENLSPALKAQAATPAGKRQIAEQLAEVKSLAHEAKRRKLDQEAKLRQQLQIQADQALANAALNQMLASTPVTEEILRKYYESHSSEYEAVQARHILIRYKGSQVPLRPNQNELSEVEALEKARQIKQRLAAGEDFATLAKAESDDVGSGGQGGSLGSFGKGQMVPEFEKVAFAQTKGMVSDPVKTQFGYHIIETQSHLTKSFDEVRSQMEQKVRPEHARALATQVRKASAVTLDETYFGKP
ncbi:MAG: peptidylprolyl isomerase [Acidobacteriia bacterium]|nr:peptidylprolyl isomerase [Terriglobia bacterium]